MDRCTSGHTNKRTQVNNKTIRFGQTEKEEPQKRSKPEQKGPNLVDTGAKRKTSKPGRQGGEFKGATQGVGGRKKWVMSDSVECIQDSGVCPLGECHSSYSRWQRRPVSLLHLLLPSDVRRCMHFFSVQRRMAFARSFNMFQSCCM